MKNWLRDIGGAVRMGLFWAAVWAPVAVLIGTLIVDPDDSMDEMWVVVGAYPGFLGGVVFFAVLRMAEGRRRFHELSLPRVAAWGAVSGLLLAALAALGIAVGLAHLHLEGAPIPNLWLRVAVITTLGSAFAASVSLAMARWWRNHFGGSRR